MYKCTCKFTCASPPPLPPDDETPAGGAALAEADTADDEAACGVFLQHRKNKRKLSNSRGDKWGKKKFHGGRRLGNFRPRRSGKGRSGKGWNNGGGSSFGGPGAWLRQKGFGKGASGKGKSKGKKGFSPKSFGKDGYKGAGGGGGKGKGKTFKRRW